MTDPGVVKPRLTITAPFCKPELEKLAIVGAAAAVGVTGGGVVVFSPPPPPHPQINAPAKTKAVNISGLIPT
jgi:hypothetical protein